MWSLGQPTPNFTLEGHDKGVNCVDYFTGGDRPFLISGADDKLVKVWDYQTKACVTTLEVSPAGAERGPQRRQRRGGSTRRACVGKRNDCCALCSQSGLAQGKQNGPIPSCYDNSYVHPAQGHTHNISSAIFHPELPVIVTVSLQSSDVLQQWAKLGPLLNSAVPSSAALAMRLHCSTPRLLPLSALRQRPEASAMLPLLAILVALTR